MLVSCRHHSLQCPFMLGLSVGQAILNPKDEISKIFNCFVYLTHPATLCQHFCDSLYFPGVYNIDMKFYSVLKTYFII